MGGNVTIAERGTRKRLLINRHIAKMTPEEIARRFSVYVVLKTACGSAGSHGKSSAVKATSICHQIASGEARRNHVFSAVSDCEAGGRRSADEIYQFGRSHA
jgi:hypothetical protein